MTDAERKALLWFEANGPVALFDSKAPSSAMRKRLVSSGYVQSVGTEPISGSPFSFTKFAITDAGLKALRQ